MSDVAELVPVEVIPPPTNYVPSTALTVEKMVNLARQMQQAKRDVLVPEVDFDQLPGTDRTALLQPGAEKLLQFCGMTFELEQVEVERDEAGHKAGVTYRATIFGPAGAGRVRVAQCDGYAGYDEERFYQSREDRQRKENSNAERYRRKPKVIEGSYRAPWHNVLMMAQKRALVGGTRHATASSGLFTDDSTSEPTGEIDTRAELVAEVLRLAGEVGPAGSDARGRLKATIEQNSLPDTPAKMSTAQLVRVIQVINTFLVEDAAGPAGEGEDDEEPRPVPPSRTHGSQPRGRQRRPEPEPEPAAAEPEYAPDDPSRPFE